MLEIVLQRQKPGLNDAFYIKGLLPLIVDGFSKILKWTQLLRDKLQHSPEQLSSTSHHCSCKQSPSFSRATVTHLSLDSLTSCKTYITMFLYTLSHSARPHRDPVKIKAGIVLSILQVRKLRLKNIMSLSHNISLIIL